MKRHSISKEAKRLRLEIQFLESRIVPTFPYSPTSYSVPPALLFPDPIFGDPADAITASATLSPSTPAPSHVVGFDPLGPRIDPGYGTSSAILAGGDSGLQLVSPLTAGTKRNVTEGFSSGGVRYFDGVFNFTSTDLASDGFGAPWTQTRSWTNAASMSAGYHNGSGWVDSQFPTLVNVTGDFKTMALVSNGTTARHFVDRSATSTSGNYVERFSGHHKLSCVGGEYVLTTPAGVRFFFSDFVGATPYGVLTKRVDSYGNTATVSYSGGKVASVSRGGSAEGASLLELWNYAYLMSGPNAGLLESVTLARGPRVSEETTIRQVIYEYYATNDNNGSIGDLKTATVKNAAGDSLGTEYYRYYPFGATNGFHGALRMAFRFDSYDRMKHSLGSTSLDTADDSLIEAFAEVYLQYDSNGRVNLQRVAGAGESSSSTPGLGTFTFTYSGNSTSSGSHTQWAVQTTETLPDGNKNVVHTNASGQVILKVFEEHSGQTVTKWPMFFQHDSSGRVKLVARPSAITGTSYADLIQDPGSNYTSLKDGDGLIVRYRYGTSTTATSGTPGDVSGYWQGMDFRRGETGTVQPQFDMKYWMTDSNTSTLALFPQASYTSYRSVNTSGHGQEPRTTNYSYSFLSGTSGIQELTVVHPPISTSQNGPGGAGDSETAWADHFGRVLWTKDSGGFVNYWEYNSPAVPVPTKSIVDVDTSIAGDFSVSVPSGLSSPSGTRLRLTTNQVADDLGRVTRVATPESRVTHIVFKDADHEARVYSGWYTNGSDPRAGYTSGPIIVYRNDRSRSYAEMLTMSVAPGISGFGPTGTESIGSLQTLTRTFVNAAGQHVQTDAFFNLNGVTYSTSGSLGTINTHFYRTLYRYDDKGLPNRTELPTGTIHRTVFDALGRTSSTWVGTDDTSTSGTWSPGNLTGTNTLATAYFEYDFGGIGDSNLTEQTDIPGGSEADRVTQMAYDWRNRLIATKQGVESSESEDVNRPIFYVEYNNLSETIRSERYDGDTISIYTDTTPADGVPDRPDDDFLRGKTGFDIDDQGRTYRTKHYSVDPDDGSVSTSILTSQNWFDRRGNVLKTVVPGVTVTKSVVDGAGRTTVVYVSDGGSDNDDWQYADDVAGDTVLEQVETEYDKDSLPIKTTRRQRFHDETDTGALIDPNGSVQARVSFTASYYDLAGRTFATVDVGTAYVSQGSLGTWTRPTTPPTPSDLVLVNSWSFNDAGWVSISVDPRGIVGRTYYDNLGRVTKTIENYVNGDPSDEDDKTTVLTYDGSDHVLTHSLLLPGNSTQSTQTTEYVYGYASGEITSNDLLAEIWHPDETTGEASEYEADLFEYNGFGETVQFTDRNGWSHEYVRDPLGRLIRDKVWVGSSLEIWLETGYDSQGNAYLFSTWDNTEDPEEFVVVNEVQREFDGRGQMLTEWQEHGGVVNTATSLKVQYTYAEATSGNTMFSRLTGISYPGGGGVTYSYGATSDLNHFISRVSSVTGGVSLSESYQYLGWSTVVSRASGNGYTWRHFGGEYGTGAGEAGDKYAGLDRFGRVIGWLWQAAGGPADFHLYGYDRNSNRMYKTDELHHAWDELYHENGSANGYDGLNQLKEFRRGTATDTNSDGHVDTITGGFYEAWDDTDAAGNFWTITASNGVENRQHNKQNEITQINNENLFYDGNGNLIEDETFGLTYRYDAWNRLVAIIDGEEDGEAYEYDALGRRIVEGANQAVPVGYDRHLYYNDAWQVIHDERPALMADPRGQPIVVYYEFNAYYWSAVGGDTMIGRARDVNDDTIYDEKLYSLQDAQGNQSALADLTGEIVERAIQTPYGDQTTTTKERQPQQPSVYEWLYFHQGLRLDRTGQFYDNRARFYSPTLMRFMQNDPIGLGPDQNMYRYVGNGPVSGSDPSGLADPRDVDWYLFRRPSCMVCHGSGVVEGRSMHDLPFGSQVNIVRWTNGTYGSRGSFVGGFFGSIRDTLDQFGKGTGNADVDFWSGVKGFFVGIGNLPAAFGRFWDAAHEDPGHAVGYIGGFVAQAWLAKKLVDVETGGVTATTSGTKPAIQPVGVGLTQSQRALIQAFANKHGVEVHLVGSRAAGTAGPMSDFDYIIVGGNSKIRAAARRGGLPRGFSGGELQPRGWSGIDVFNGTMNPLDATRPHIIFKPQR